MLGGTISDWILYTDKNNIYYSTSETNNINDLKPLSSMNWSYTKNVKYYLYQKN